MTRTDAEKAPEYIAEFWTTIGQVKDGQHVTHDHWVVLNDRKEVVAAGGESFCKEYADSLNKNTGENYMTRDDAEKAVRERWERLGLAPEAAPIMFGMDVDNMLDENIQAAYRKQIDETGRSVPQYSDQAGGGE